MEHEEDIHHNVTVACSHDQMLKKQIQERKNSIVGHELTFADAILGAGLEEEIGESENIDESGIGKGAGNVNGTVNGKLNGHIESDDDEEIEKRLEQHLQSIREHKTVISFDDKNNNTENHHRKAKSSDAVDIPRRKHHRSSFSSSPKKMSPTKSSDSDNEGQQKRRDGRNAKSARVRKSGVNALDQRPRSASPLKAKKDQNQMNGHSKGSDSPTTPKSPTHRRKTMHNIDYLGDIRNRENMQERLKERRHSSGMVLVSREKKENEHRPITAASSASTASTASKASTRSRRSSVPAGRFTRQELEQYLPRKSFFDCHEKALKESEENESPSEKHRRKRQSVLERLHGGASDTFESNPAVTKLNDNGIVSISKEGGNINAEKSEDSSLTAIKTVSQQNNSEQQEQQKKQQQQQQKMTKKKSKKKLEEEEDDIKVDYSILTHFLKFVRDHPDDYQRGRDSLIKATRTITNPTIRHEDSLIKMAQIYERGHHGESIDGLLVEAVHEIRPQLLEALDAVQTPEETRTEFEKHINRLYKWVNTISTAQLNKAKELALKDMGDEDQAQTKWWLALRSCHYIRTPDDPPNIRNPVQ